jgi:hypothetical protein
MYLIACLRQWQTSGRIGHANATYLQLTLNVSLDVGRCQHCDTLDPPLLTLFAIEEPETHVAPHLLGRVLGMFRSLVEAPRGQAVFVWPDIGD